MARGKGIPSLREQLAAGLLLVLALTVLGHFIAMWVLGVVYIGEPNSAIRVFETVMFGFISVFAIWNFIAVMRR